MNKTFHFMATERNKKTPPLRGLKALSSLCNCSAELGKSSTFQTIFDSYITYLKDSLEMPMRGISKLWCRDPAKHPFSALGNTLARAFRKLHASGSYKIIEPQTGLS